MSTAKKLWIGIPSCIIVFSLIVWGLGSIILSVITEDVNTRIERQKELDAKSLESAFCFQKVDSLVRVNTELSKYKALTQAMLHRDVAVTQLNHSIGDIVILKNDSSVAVIEDVVIGGGKYNYYIKYKLLFKDNTTKEVIPELIY